MFLVSTLLMVGLGEFQLRQTEAQVIWESIDAPKDNPPLCLGYQHSDSGQDNLQ